VSDSSFYKACENYDQDVSNIAENTLLQEDQISECSECGESVEDGGAILYPVKNQCVTVQCGNCGSVYDVWPETYQRTKGENPK